MASAQWRARCKPNLIRTRALTPDSCPRPLCTLHEGAAPSGRVADAPASAPTVHLSGAPVRSLRAGTGACPSGLNSANLASTPRARAGHPSLPLGASRPHIPKHSPLPFSPRPRRPPEPGPRPAARERLRPRDAAPRALQTVWPPHNTAARRAQSPPPGPAARAGRERSAPGGPGAPGPAHLSAPRGPQSAAFPAPSLGHPPRPRPPPAPPRAQPLP